MAKELVEYATCNECGWTGDCDELVDDNDDGKFDQCGGCGSTNLDWDEEEREQ